MVLRCVLGVGSGSSSFLFFWWVRLRSPGLLLSLIFLGTRHVGPQKGDNIVVLLNRLGTRRVLDDTIETVNGPGRRAFLIVRIPRREPHTFTAEDKLCTPYSTMEALPDSTAQIAAILSADVASCGRLS